MFCLLKLCDDTYVSFFIHSHYLYFYTEISDVEEHVIQSQDLYFYREVDVVVRFGDEIYFSSSLLGL